jgi:hypothetical protein
MAITYIGALVGRQTFSVPTRWSRPIEIEIGFGAQEVVPSVAT